MEQRHSYIKNKSTLFDNFENSNVSKCKQVKFPKYYTLIIKLMDMHTLNSYYEGFSSFIKLSIQSYLSNKKKFIGETELKFNNSSPTFEKNFTFNFDMEKHHNLIFEIFSIKNKNVSINIGKVEIDIIELIKSYKISKDLNDDDNLPIGKLLVEICPNFEFFINMDLSLKYLITGVYKNKLLKSKFLIRNPFTNHKLYESEMIALGLHSEFTNVQLIVPISQKEIESACLEKYNDKNFNNNENHQNPFENKNFFNSSHTFNNSNSSKSGSQNFLNISNQERSISLNFSNNKNSFYSSSDFMSDNFFTKNNYSNSNNFYTEYNDFTYFIDNKIQIEISFYNIYENLLQTEKTPLKLKNDMTINKDENLNRISRILKSDMSVNAKNDYISVPECFGKDPNNKNKFIEIFKEQTNQQNTIDLGFKEFNLKYFLNKRVFKYIDYISILNNETLNVEFTFLIDISRSIFTLLDNYQYMILIKELMTTFYKIYSNFTDLPLKLKFIFSNKNSDIKNTFVISTQIKGFYLEQTMETILKNVLELGEKEEKSLMDNFSLHSEICPEIEKCLEINDNSINITEKTKILFIISDFSFLDLNKYFYEYLNNNQQSEKFILNNILLRDKEELIEEYGDNWKEKFYFNSNSADLDKLHSDGVLLTSKTILNKEKLFGDLIRKLNAKIEEKLNK